MKSFIVSNKTIKWFTAFYILLFLIMTVVPINNTSLSFEKIIIANIRLDHLLHMFIFFPFAFLIRIIKGENYFVSGKRIFLWITIGVSIAILAELIQLFIPNKSFTISDLIFNVIGIAMGLLIFLIKPHAK